MKNALLILLFLTSVYSYGQTAQDLPCKESYPNKRCKQRYNEDANGQIHGKFIAYNPDGSVDEVSYYSHGKLHGTSTEFYGWGKFVTTYANGKEHGLYQKIASDGKILEKGNYTNGLKTGYWLEYGTDKGSYVNGQKHGPWIIHQRGWNSTEGGMTKGNFNNGDHIGTWTNLIVIGVLKPNNIHYDTQREIAIPTSSNYSELEEYYSPGYKAIFNKEGYYIEAYDSSGVAVVNPEK